MELLTDQEIAKLKACRSEMEWNSVCDQIKDSREGQYPRDWYARIVMSGVAGQVQANFA